MAYYSVNIRSFMCLLFLTYSWNNICKPSSVSGKCVQSVSQLVNKTALLWLPTRHPLRAFSNVSVSVMSDFIIRTVLRVAGMG